VVVVAVEAPIVVAAGTVVVIVTGHVEGSQDQVPLLAARTTELLYLVC